MRVKRSATVFKGTEAIGSPNADYAGIFGLLVKASRNFIKLFQHSFNTHALDRGSIM